MATMAELEGFLTKKFELRKSGEGRYDGTWLTLNNRSQMVLLDVYDGKLDVYDGKLVVSSPFAKVSELPLPAAMKAAARFVFGVVVYEDHYCLRHVIPLADIDESEVEWALNVISACADQIEQDTVGGDKL